MRSKTRSGPAPGARIPLPDTLIRPIFNLLVEYMTAALLDDTFHALSHQVRRDMLRRLSAKAHRVTELAALYPDLSLNAVSKHVKVLERAGLVDRRKDGRIHHLNLDAEPLREAAEEIEFFRKFWETQLDALGRFLESTTEQS